MPLLGKGSNHSLWNWLRFFRNHSAVCWCSISKYSAVDINLSTLVFIVTGCPQPLTVIIPTFNYSALNTVLGTACSYSRYSKAVFQVLRHDRWMCDYWWGHRWNMGGVICIQLISVGIVFHFSLKSLSETAGDNLEAMVGNAVTCLSQRAHTEPQSRGAFLWQPAAWYQNIHRLQCLISLAAKGCCPLKHSSCSPVSIVIPVCLTKQLETSHVGWNVLIKNTCGIFCGSDKSGRPCLTV